MRRLGHLALYVPAIALVAVASTEPRLAGFVLRNLVVQVVLFTAVAAVPAYRTGTMSYVAVAWPWGLAAIGLQVVLVASGRGLQSVTIAVIYLAIGVRMGLPGLVHLVRHRGLGFEFPRYRYQR